ncbi:MAG: phospholipase D-like domain-containing protein [Erythrobacter sp.]
MTNPKEPEPATAGHDDYCDPDPFEVETHGHTFTFYPCGKDRLEALLDVIASAKETLNCFYFLYEEDATGERVRDALTEAAKRGVEVTLYIDAFGSGAEPPFFDCLTQAGGTFARFEAKFSKRFLIRNHQKMCIADNQCVMAGGFNISDAYFDPPSKNGWNDLGVRMTGPLVQRYTDWFRCIDEWIRTDGSEYRKIREMVRDWDPGKGPVQLIMGGPTSVTSEWARAIKHDIANAEKLDVVTAYFAPPRSMRQVLRRAGRHKRLRMILASKSDFAITVLAARLHYRRLVKAGTKLFEYQPSKLHMKLMVLDNVCHFGSGNLDMRSVRLNLEVMVRVEDAEMADKLRGLIDHMERASRRVDKSWFRQYAGWSDKLRWFVSSFMLRFVDYNLSRSLNLGPSKLKNASRMRSERADE